MFILSGTEEKATYRDLVCSVGTLYERAYLSGLPVPCTWFPSHWTILSGSSILPFELPAKSGLVQCDTETIDPKQLGLEGSEYG